MLRRKAEGAYLGWLIVTGISQEMGWSPEKVQQREEEIEQVSAGLGIDQVYNLRFPTTKLDAFPMSEVIQKFSEVFRDFEPEEVLIPHRRDVHTDHRVVFDAASACCKWFRYPSVRRVLAYETLSETEFEWFHRLNFLLIYLSILVNFWNAKSNCSKSIKVNLTLSFPRSSTAVRALAQFRGC